MVDERPIGSLAREGDAHLVLVLAARLFLTVRASRPAPPEEGDLGDPLPDVQANRKGRDIGQLDRENASPARLEWCHIDQQPAPGVGTLPQQTAQTSSGMSKRSTDSARTWEFGESSNGPSLSIARK